MPYTPPDVRIVKIETKAGVTVHEFYPSHQDWRGRLRKSGLTGFSAARENETAVRRERGPIVTGFTFGARDWQVDYLLASRDLTDHHAILMRLKGEIRQLTDLSYWLVFYESGVLKRREITVRGVEPSDKGVDRVHYILQITIIGDRSYLYQANVDHNVGVGASGMFEVVSTGTVSSDDLVIEVEPQTTKEPADGQRFMRRVWIFPRGESVLARWPVELIDDLTASRWDHEALVDDDKSMTDGSGDDVELYEYSVPVWRTDYSEVSRGFNAESKATSIWKLHTAAPRKWIVASASGPDLVVDDEIGQRPTLPAVLLFRSGGTVEIMRITAVDEDARTFTVTRGYGPTSEETIPAGSTVWLGREEWLVYGWMVAPAPLDDATQRPPILLSSTSGEESTNAKWYWKRWLKNTALGDVLSIYPSAAAWYPFDSVRMDHGQEVKDGKGSMYTRWAGFTAAGATHATPASALSIAYQPDGPSGRTPYASVWRWLSQVPVKAARFYWAVSTAMLAPNEAQGEIHAIQWLGLVQRIARYFTGGTGGGAASGNTSFTFSSGAVRGFEVGVHTWTPNPDSGGSENLYPQEPSTGAGFYVTKGDVDFADDEYPFVVWGDEETCYQIGRPEAPAALDNGAGQTLYLHGIVVPDGDTLTLNMLTGEATVGDVPVSHLLTGDYLELPPPADPLSIVPLTFTLTDAGTVDLDITVTGRSAWA